MATIETTPGSTGYFEPREEACFTFARNGTQFVASPSSITSSSSPMMTPLPYKMQTSSSAIALTPHPMKDEKKRLSEYEFPAPAAKAESLYQSYLNHPSTQFRQQRFQELQAESYASKYASYTNSSQSLVRSHSLNNNSKKPTTTLALSMIEKEKMAFQYSPSNRDSVSSPPPPYLYSDHGVAPLDQSSHPLSSHNTMITPASLAWSKRNSLPLLSSSRPSATLNLSLANPIARNARELKRHSLPVTPSSTAGVQWPSAMTVTMAAVTRPKLARTMPPQAIPILYSGETRTPLVASTATTVFTPRTSRFFEKNGETDTLYSYKFSDDGMSSPKSAKGSSGIGARTRGRDVTDIHDKRDTSYSPNSEFPGFWKDAKHGRMHWVFLSLSLVAAGSALWIYLMVPALVLWSTALPGVLAVLLGAQYVSYRWRRNKHSKYKELLKGRRHSSAGLSSMRAASAALTNSSAAATANHAHRPSDSSMHTSVGSTCSDSFLEPHQPSPPNNLKYQFQHQYFRTNSTSSTTAGSISVSGSPPPPTTTTTTPPHHKFADGYQQQSQYQNGSLPEYRQSWGSLHNQKSQELLSNKPRSRTIQRQNSSSSIASSETVSSTSTASEIESCAPLRSPGLNNPMPLMSSPIGPALKSSDSLTSLNSVMMMAPPPAYVSKKCGEVITGEGGETLSEKAKALIGVELPEISSVGDLLSEFTVDFGTIQY
ncbi:hypothetical protein BGZ76_000783 [Entomortierella beljakovae]|nr:hypothetical protein BGZ76_000783 [Entomortierella beljakovae]